MEVAMQQNALFDVFLNLLKDLFDAENQIVQTLPKIIHNVSNGDLKEALSQHLDETKNQVQRLKKIFKMLNENPTGITCTAMQAIFEEGDKHLQQNLPTAVRDACAIIDCQKVEHYEISSYGSARTLAHHLNNIGLDNRIDFDEIADLLQQTLDEENAADEKLTDIAEGGFFSTGINEEAEKAEKAGTPSPKRKSTNL
jgi:ferritin-like metal-binding protein YciE